MKASELRIRNIIQTHSGVIGKVVSIGSEEQEFEQVYCECDESYEWFFKDNYFGVPLTEEWLLKFKEVRKFGGTIYLPLMNLKAEIHFEIYGNHIVSTIKSSFAELILDPIKYVHQLQNLYFALTGEELELKQ